MKTKHMDLGKVTEHEGHEEEAGSLATAEERRDAEDVGGAEDHNNEPGAIQEELVLDVRFIYQRTVPLESGDDGRIYEVRQVMAGDGGARMGGSRHHEDRGFDEEGHP